MINLLTKDVYNKISAGEVVERPASVVKELFENAIDSGANEVSVYIENGGLDKITVVDNGCGMDKDDLPKSFLPHATSKLKNSDDLLSIETLGFRGEALASISAVSAVTITTKTADGQVGYSLTNEGGVFGDITQAPALDGTTVEVTKFFFNTPARLKFLKTPKSEENEVTSLMEKMILSNPYVAIKYFVNGKLILQSYGEGVKDAVLSVYNVDTINNCYEISAEKNGIYIEGFLGSINFLKANRSHQTIVVNGRYVTDNTISTAIHNAYSSYLMKRQYPFYVLSITMPTETVDVDVHPRKAEVRFQNNQIVYGAIYSTVSKVLDGSANALNIVVAPPKATTLGEILETAKKPVDSFDVGIPLNELTPVQKAVYDIATQNESGFYDLPKGKYKDLPPILPRTGVSQPREEVVVDMTGDKIDDIFKENKKYIERLESQKAQEVAEQSAIKTEAPIKVIGQALNTYLIVECDDELIIIDQHAAHERILFDGFIEKMKTEGVVKQTLLMPYVFKVNAKESDVLFDRMQVFRDIGFDIEAADDTTFKVYSVPLDFVDINFDLFFADLLNDSNFKDEKIPTVLKEKVIQKACKSAIKSGDSLSSSEINALLCTLKQNWGLHCPHGRPVCVKITRKEIDKWFKRII